MARERKQFLTIKEVIKTDIRRMRNMNRIKQGSAMPGISRFIHGYNNRPFHEQAVIVKLLKLT